MQAEDECRDDEEGGVEEDSVIERADSGCDGCRGWLAAALASAPAPLNIRCFVHPELRRFVFLGVVVDVIYVIARCSDILGPW